MVPATPTLSPNTPHDCARFHQTLKSTPTFMPSPVPTATHAPTPTVVPTLGPSPTPMVARANDQIKKPRALAVRAARPSNVFVADTGKHQARAFTPGLTFIGVRAAVMASAGNLAA